MSKAKLTKPKPVPVDHFEAVPFTGVAKSLECYWHPAGHNNFKIVTLTIQDGIVMKKQYSDPYQLFEANAFLEVEVVRSGDNLRANFKDGLAWLK
jgi:hypothetical protein